MAKMLTGVVSSDRGDKTIVVTVQVPKTHPVYKKKYNFSRRFAAHDEKNQAHTGDKVMIGEVRPISKTKKFVLLKIIETAAIRHTEGESK